ncbi:uncharacterized protein K452DRAFT_294439 [Aplosporella prunicola CBS 121167]|uniref:Ketoreductase domain-containing protein n=1 Tax=Aplosporella prunicola CBS 121167 TaxID=1176127 RepID=A0A6A6BUL8_9PEZI|nr:uncharacterized protein K452DRAFT_294439 [Aplosporella prunicola CBS 121167]KAF2146914.1 hypothetical protein K452DRAFT_294439 [Aplosporella prunicola CBS 121167]
MSLQGKTAIVTGGARGIGKGIVKALAAEGAKVAFTYVSDSSRALASTLIAELAAQGGTAIAIQADMASPSAPETIVQETLSQLATAHIDILINNAGVGGNASLEAVQPSDYDSIMSVNVRSVIFMTQAILPFLRSGGRIVNLSSISARGGYATQTVYAASKAAVEGLTRVWARELGHRYGVTVNAVNPGPVDTDMYRAAGEVHLRRMDEENTKVPAAPRCGTEADVAGVVVFLVGESARWVTGDVVCANGGMVFV